jgi:uncharacterized protein YukE
MIIKADKEELKVVSNDLIKSSKNIENEIEIWEKTIEQLKEIWQGKDANMFYSRISMYLTKVKMLGSSSEAIGRFINIANDKYIECDEEFANVLKRENDRYESNSGSNNNN